MLVSLALLTLLGAPADPLLASFQNPPASAKPYTWWHWMNGNVTREGIKADLEAMKEVGIGGAQMFTVDQGIPAGNVPYNSQKWRDMTAYAVQEADRLGLELCIHNCAGWSSSGGPWITPENAMQVVGWSSVKVHGPTHFSQELPPIQAPQVYAKVDYARDIAIYAFPTPADGEKPADFLGKTGVVQQPGLQPDFSRSAPNVSIPRKSVLQLRLNDKGRLDWDVPSGDWTILRVGHVPTGKDNHPAPPEGDGLEVDKLGRKALDQHWEGMMAKVIAQVRPLTGKSLNNALIDSYEVGSQNWTELMPQEFKSRHGYDIRPWLPVLAGFTVGSREESERFLWDLRRTIADLYAENYFGYFGELCHKHGMKFSTEPYGNGGFDPLQSGGKADIPMGEFWIGGLALETTRVASSIGHTYGRSVIGAESFTADDVRGRWLEDPYSVKAIGDQVFCNGINRYIFHRYAAQPWLNLKPGMTMGPWGTHLERTQTWWTEARAWMRYIARCQSLLQQGTFVADTLYYSGENSPTDWVYKPAKGAVGHDYDSCDATILKQLSVRNGQLVLPSGMTYRVLVLPETPFMRAEILTKVRSLIQQGATVVGPRPTSSPTLTNRDAEDTAVKRMADEMWGNVDGNKVQQHSFGKGRIVFGRTLDQIFASSGIAPDFAYRGIGSRAKLSYIHRRIGGAEVYFVSNQAYQPVSADCTFRVSGKAPELWHADSGVAEDAPVYRTGARTSVTLNLQPAESVFVVFRKAPKPHLTSFISRAQIDAVAKAPKVDIISARYESADGRGADVTDKVRQMVRDGETEIAASNENFGDPVYNVVKHLVVVYSVDGQRKGQTIPENGVAVLVPSSRSGELTYALKVGEGELTLTSWQGGQYTSTLEGGKKVVTSVPAPVSLDFSSSWSLKFPPKFGAPASAEFSKLISWTEHPDIGIRYFSGSAVYSKDFTFPAGRVRDAVLLDLGKVKNFATITLNGKELPVLWKEPFAVTLTGRVRAGLNHLEIKVTNLWPNRLIGDEHLPEDAKWHGATLDGWPDWIKQNEPRPKTGRVAFTTWKFWTKDSPLLESGLLGPVQLKIAKPISIKLK